MHSICVSSSMDQDSSLFLLTCVLGVSVALTKTEMFAFSGRLFKRDL